jgi:hypothetical protein
VVFGVGDPDPCEEYARDHDRVDAGEHRHAHAGTRAVTQHRWPRAMGQAVATSRSLDRSPPRWSSCSPACWSVAANISNWASHDSPDASDVMSDAGSPQICISIRVQPS